jgi:hypothetical protein
MIFIIKLLKLSSMDEYILSEDLAVWFGKKKKGKGSSQPKGPWVNICKKKEGGGHPPCGRKDADEGSYPVCRAVGVAGKMTQAEKDSACRRKREKEKKDPQSGKGQKPTRIKIKDYKKKNESIERLVKVITEKFKVEPNEYDKIYEDNNYLLVAPLTHKASCKYGSNTKWCTTKRHDDMDFEEYFNSGVLVYLIIKDKELSDKLGSGKYTIYRPWGSGIKMTSVFNDINDEFFDGQEWIYNEFEKINKVDDIVKLLDKNNSYYNRLDYGSKNNDKKMKESVKRNINIFKNKVVISEDLKYHFDNKISISENLYRYGSPKYFKIINEAREVYKKGYGKWSEEDVEILESERGKFIIYNGERLPLDFPMVNESDNKDVLKNYAALIGYIIGLSNDAGEKKEKKTVEEMAALTELRVYYEILRDGGNPNTLSYAASKVKEYVEREIQKLTPQQIDQLEKDGENVKTKTHSTFGVSLNESEYKGKKVELGKPKTGGPKKWYVYVRNPKTGKIKKVSYGSPDMSANWNDPKARASFAARHQCEKKKDRTTPGYWACRAHKDFGKNVSGRFW